MINKICKFKQIGLNSKVKNLSAIIITKILQPYHTNNQM
jgi:hypothetical protein